MTTSLALLLLALPQVQQEAYVKASNTGSGAAFGQAVAVWGDTLVVGAPGEASTAPGAGATYVFRHAGSSWVQEACLKASNVGQGDAFGSAVALHTDTLIVGAPGEDSGASGVNGNQADDGASGAGAVYVFVRSGTSWSQQAYLKASNPDPLDLFGGAVGVHGDLVVVGARQEESPATGIDGDQGNAVNGQYSGAAYVFVRSGTSWSQQAYLKASNSNTLWEFGTAVAVSDETVVVGAPYEAFGGPSPESMPDVGAAYVFVRSGTSWSQQAYLKASNDGWGDVFGSAISIDGDRLLVGAPGESGSGTGVNPPDNDVSMSAGAAYVFERSGTTWTETGHLKALNSGSFDRFGASVAISGGVVAVGARNEESLATGIDGNPFDDSAFSAGAVYLFHASGPSWTPGSYVKASNTDVADLFYRAALAGGTLVVGAEGEDSSATGIDGTQADDGALGAGAAYAFDLGGPDVYCTAKASSAGCSALISTSAPALQPTSGAADYAVTASGVQGFKNGLVIVGIAGPAAAPFNGGVLCVQPPLKRGPVVASGGSGPGQCDGGFSTPVNDGQLVPAGLDAGPGNSGWYQYWVRDPGDAFGVALSNALRLDFE